MQTIDVAERRTRLAVRHRLEPGHRAAGVVDATESMVCLHASDPSDRLTFGLERVDGIAVPGAWNARSTLDRSLVKHLSMRRTLFVFPRRRWPSRKRAPAGASPTQTCRLIRHVEEAEPAEDGEHWLKRASDQVLAAALSDGREATSSELRDEIPALQGTIATGEGKSWRQPPRPARRPRPRRRAGPTTAARRGDPAGDDDRHPRPGRRSAGKRSSHARQAEGAAGLVERWLRSARGRSRTSSGGSAIHRRERQARPHRLARQVGLDHQTVRAVPTTSQPTAPDEPRLRPPPLIQQRWWFDASGVSRGPAN